MSNVIIYDDLIGKTFTSVTSTEDTMSFIGEDATYMFYHEQDCCEAVSLEEVVGDLSDLQDSPILVAEEVINDATECDDCGSKTWTFYKFSTIKGSVTVRWLGESNGYYSESVDFKEIKK